MLAEIAKELNVLTVAVVTKPFAFEGKRQRVAQEGIEALAHYVDSLIIVPNEKLIEVLGNQVTLDQAFAANDVLHGAVAGIAEIISCPGMINVDFADVKTVMAEMGMAMMGSAKAAARPRTARRRTGCRLSAARGHTHRRCARRAGQHLGEQVVAAVAGDLRHHGGDQVLRVGYGKPDHRGGLRRPARRRCTGHYRRHGSRQGRHSPAAEGATVFRARPARITSPWKWITARSKCRR